MKIKADFITNSSSCSFTIATSYLNEMQIVAIINHIEFAFLLDQLYPDKWNFGWAEKWKVDVYSDRIEVDTSMDNFDMETFIRAIRVPEEAITDYDHRG